MIIEVTPKYSKEPQTLEFINKKLEEFLKVAEETYEKSRENAVKSRKSRILGISKKIEDFVPEFITNINYIEGDKIIIKNNIPLNILGNISIPKRFFKSITDSIYKYLKDLGYECEVKIVG